MSYLHPTHHLPATPPLSYNCRTFLVRCRQKKMGNQERARQERQRWRELLRQDDQTANEISTALSAIATHLEPFARLISDFRASNPRVRDIPVLLTSLRPYFLSTYIQYFNFYRNYQSDRGYQRNLIADAFHELFTLMAMTVAFLRHVFVETHQQSWEGEGNRDDMTALQMYVWPLSPPPPPAEFFAGWTLEDYQERNQIDNRPGHVWTPRPPPPPPPPPRTRNDDALVMSPSGHFLQPFAETMRTFLENMRAGDDESVLFQNVGRNDYDDDSTAFRQYVTNYNRPEELLAAGTPSVGWRYLSANINDTLMERILAALWIAGNDDFLRTIRTMQSRRYTFNLFSDLAASGFDSVSPFPSNPTQRRGFRRTNTQQMDAFMNRLNNIPPEHYEPPQQEASYINPNNRYQTSNASAKEPLMDNPLSANSFAEMLEQQRGLFDNEVNVDFTNLGILARFFLQMVGGELNRMYQWLYDERPIAGRTPTQNEANVINEINQRWAGQVQPTPENLYQSRSINPINPLAASETVLTQSSLLNWNENNNHQTQIFPLDDWTITRELHQPATGIRSNIFYPYRTDEFRSIRVTTDDGANLYRINSQFPSSSEATRTSAQLRTTHDQIIRLAAARAQAAPNNALLLAHLQPFVYRDRISGELMPMLRTTPITLDQEPEIGNYQASLLRPEHNGESIIDFAIRCALVQVVTSDLGMLAIAIILIGALNDERSAAYARRIWNEIPYFGQNSREPLHYINGARLNFDWGFIERLMDFLLRSTNKNDLIAAPPLPDWMRAGRILGDGNGFNSYYDNMPPAFHYRSWRRFAHNPRYSPTPMDAYLSQRTNTARTAEPVMSLRERALRALSVISDVSLYRNHVISDPRASMMAFSSTVPRSQTFPQTENGDEQDGVNIFNRYRARYDNASRTLRSTDLSRHLRPIPRNEIPYSAAIDGVDFQPRDLHPRVIEAMHIHQNDYLTTEGYAQFSNNLQGPQTTTTLLSEKEAQDLERKRKFDDIILARNTRLERREHQTKMLAHLKKIHENEQTRLAQDERAMEAIRQSAASLNPSPRQPFVEADTQAIDQQASPSIFSTVRFGARQSILPGLPPPPFVGAIGSNSASLIAPNLRLTTEPESYSEALAIDLANQETNNGAGSAGPANQNNQTQGLDDYEIDPATARRMATRYPGRAGKRRRN